jgi:hypothetical protein
MPKEFPKAVEGFLKAEYPCLPSLLKSNKGHSIWFKQDDTFEAFLVSTRVIIKTTDCGNSFDPVADIFYSFWSALFK